MKFKVFYKARQKNAVRHYVTNSKTHGVMWFDSMFRAMRYISENKNSHYDYFVSDYYGAIVEY